MGPKALKSNMNDVSQPYPGHENNFTYDKKIN